MSTNTRYFKDERGNKIVVHPEIVPVVMTESGRWVDVPFLTLSLLTNPEHFIETDSTGTPLGTGKDALTEWAEKSRMSTKEERASIRAYRDSLFENQQDPRDAQIQSLAATVAAMREALIAADHAADRVLNAADYRSVTESRFLDIRKRIAAALAPDAGKAMLEEADRLRKAEVELRIANADLHRNGTIEMETLRAESAALRERLDLWEAEGRKLIAKVDRGEARSVRTYARFKELLTTPAQPGRVDGGEA